MNSKFKKFQLAVLIISFVGIVINVARLIINPEISKREVTEYSFPEQILLPQWTFVKSTQPKENIDYEVVISNRKYLYEKGDRLLEINNRYVVGTRGTYHGVVNLEDKFNNNNETEFLLSMKTKNNLNYALFVHEKKAYLVSCINPNGGSTITHTQFMGNRYQNDLTWRRFLPWLTGKEPSIDLRCLWSYLSLPINNTSVENAYQILEDTWFNWYDYWCENYPEY